MQKFLTNLLHTPHLRQILTKSHPQKSFKNLPYALSLSFSSNQQPPPFRSSQSSSNSKSKWSRPTSNVPSDNTKSSHDPQASSGLKLTSAKPQMSPKEILEEQQTVSKPIIKASTETLSLDMIERYLSDTIANLIQYKNLKSPNEKKTIQQDLVKILESCYQPINTVLPKIKQTKKDRQSSRILHSFFNIFSYCFNLNLHSQNMYELIIRPLLAPGIVFQYSLATRMPLAFYYMTLYEEDHLNSNIYIDIFHCFTNERYHQPIFMKVSKPDFLLIIHSFCFAQVSDPQLKLLVCGELNKLLKAHACTPGEILKVFASFCQNPAFLIENPCVDELEAQLLNIDLASVEPKALTAVITNIKAIHTFSKVMFTKIINHLTQYPEVMNDKILAQIARDSDEINFPPHFNEFLNHYIKENYQLKKIPISILLGFINSFVKKKNLDLELFKHLETYILSNLDQCAWNFLDLHHIFWSCITLTYDDAPFFKYLEKQTQRVLLDPKLDAEKFGILFWEIVQASHLHSFDFFIEILKRINQNNFQIEKDLKNFTTILYSVALSIAEYMHEEPELYQKRYKRDIKEQLYALRPLINTAIPDFETFLKQDVETQVKIFQFVLSMKFEFPDLEKQIQVSSQVLKHFEEVEFTPRLKASNLYIDVEDILKKMGLEYEAEKRETVYFIDLFIKPDIALQVEGVKHYTLYQRAERNQDLLRDYHLKSFGYKVVKVPFFDFSKFAFTEVEKRKEYLQNLLFEKN